MNKENPSVSCRKCKTCFQPDVSTRDPWVCPNCKEKNPNLLRHYRSVADLFILGLIGVVIFIIIGIRGQNISMGLIFLIAQAAILLTSIVFIYKTKTPWKDKAAKSLIWIVYGLGFLFNVILPLLLHGKIIIPLVVVYLAIFTYLFWLNSQAAKCTDNSAQLIDEN